MGLSSNHFHMGRIGQSHLLQAQPPLQKNSNVEGPFQSSMLELNRMRSGSKLFDVLVSLTVNLAILAAPVFAGLYFTDTLNLKPR
jgi:hypothetical protein